MRIYKVQFSVDGFDLVIDGIRRPGGFVKNEYVLSSSVDRAVEVAKRRIILAGLDYPLIVDGDVRRLRFVVDDVEASLNVWWLLRKEGRIYYPANID